jgi:hypothetical protein
MKTIKLNGKKMDITAAEGRALNIIASYDFAAPGDAFEEGPRKWSKYILPRGSRAEELGVNITNAASIKRAKKYLKAHPRRRVCITGDPRRINAILNKLAVTS